MITAEGDVGHQQATGVNNWIGANYVTQSVGILQFQRTTTNDPSSIVVVVCTSEYYRAVANFIDNHIGRGSANVIQRDSRRVECVQLCIGSSASHAIASAVDDNTRSVAAEFEHAVAVAVNV